MSIKTIFYNYILTLPMQLLKPQLFQIIAYFVAQRKSSSPPGWNGGGKSSKTELYSKLVFKLTQKIQALENRVSHFSNCTSIVRSGQKSIISPPSLYPLFVEEIQSS